MLAKTLVSAVLTACLLLTTVQAGEVLDSIMSKKLIKVATDSNWPPQSFINEKDQMDGFDVDIAREIARRLGVEIEFVTPSWDIIVAGNWNRRWDLHVGSMTPTRKRAEKLSFPAVYYYTPATVAVHEQSSVSKISELSGKKVGTGTSTTFEAYLLKNLSMEAEATPKFSYQINNPKIITYENSLFALDDLRLGDSARLDAVISSMPTIMEAISKGYPIKVIGDPVFYEPLAISIDLGDAEFDSKLEDIINRMHQDGNLSAISKKWCGVDYAITR